MQIDSINYAHRELEKGSKAYTSGDHGRARICARRAVWFSAACIFPLSMNALAVLDWLAHNLPSPFANIALLLRRGERHRLNGEDVSLNPNDDAKILIEYIATHRIQIHQKMNSRSIPGGTMALILTTIFLTASTLLATSSDPISWKLHTTRLVAQPNDTVTLSLTATVQTGWYTYGVNEYVNDEGIGPQRTEFSFRTPDLKLLAGKIRINPKPSIEYDSAFEITVEKLKGTVRFTAPFIIKHRNPGVYTDTLIVYYQLCTSRNCLPPAEVLLPFELHIADNATKSAVQSITTATINSRNPQPNVVPDQVGRTIQQTQSTSSVRDSSSWWGLLILAFILGIGSWVMPCVYPMIPITVSFFTKRTDSQHTKPLLDALIYSLGIISTFVIFGVLAAFFFGATAGRDIATNPWLNAALAVLFLVIAGNLFGMYELRLPSSLINTLNRESMHVRGYRSTFLMGMVFSLTSFTCTVPFVDLIAKMAADGVWFRPIVAMTFYASVFALPFFLLSLFPTYLQRLPRSGIWMNHIKVSLAFIEIAFAVSYFARVDSILGWQILSRELVLAMWASCTLLTGLYAIGIFKTKLDSPLEHVGGIRATVATLLFALTLYLVQGMFGGSVGTLESFIYVESARPIATSVDIRNSPSIQIGQWTEDLDQALAHARENNTLVFIDFTGVSCTNCRWMEKNIFTKPEVQRYFNRMILVRAYTDRRNHPRDEYNKRYQQEHFGSTLLPFYVILSPSGIVRATSTYTSSVEEFINFLQKGLSSRVQLN